MSDFIEVMSYFGYDLAEAQKYIDEAYQTPNSVIQEVLLEVGLD